MTHSDDRSYYYSFNVLRLILPFFVCLNSFGFSATNPASKFVQNLCGFAGVTFFVLSGYLVLGDENKLDEKIGRALKRTAIMCGAVMGLYLLFNLVFWLITKTNICPFYELKTTWLNFIVLNKWPFLIGENFWFIHCLLYGYIAVFILNRFDLLRYDWLIFAVCMIITLLTGEFAGLINFRILDYTCLPANVITRSLPYLLLGRIIAKNRGKYKKKKPELFFALIVIGAILSVAEYWLLNSLGKYIYGGHFIGSGIIATAFVMLFSCNREFSRHLDLDFSNIFAKAVYVLHQPVGFLLIALVSNFKFEWIKVTVPALPFFIWIIIFVISLLTNRMRNDIINPKLKK